jgi:acetyltransferase-like isoleucine patch superfamily enzyme
LVDAQVVDLTLFRESQCLENCFFFGKNLLVEALVAVKEEPMSENPPLSPQHYKMTHGKPLRLYKELVVGDASWIFFSWYEAVTFLTSNLPGLAGLGLRGFLYPSLLQRCGNGPAFGRGVVLRRPHTLSLGRKIIIDDFSVLDQRGKDASIIIDDYAAIGRFSSLTAKNGMIHLERGVNVSSHCRIATESSITIGESTLVAAFCYIGPGNHLLGDEHTPLVTLGMENKGGVTIGKNCWIGAHTTVMDGVTIGDNAIIGAHSFVKDSIPAGTIAFGVPAKVKDQREHLNKELPGNGVR